MKPPLKVLAVGTGRDGTLSLNQMLGDIFQLNGLSGISVHEYEARNFYDNFCAYCETGDEKNMDAIRGLIDACPHRAIVGNGYASLLPMFAASNPDLKLIHIRRLDKESLHPVLYS